MIPIPEPYFPSPWQLKGEGVILTYLFKKAWVEEYGFLPVYLRGNFQGGLGFVMIVNYHESPVGAYKELLFIPGKFSHTGKSVSLKSMLIRQTAQIMDVITGEFPKKQLLSVGRNRTMQTILPSAFTAILFLTAG